MADSSTFLDPSVTMSLMAPGMVDPSGNFDPQAYQQARQNYGQLGMAAALLAASGASRLPVTLGAALGQGLQGMMGAEQAYDQQALRGAQAGYYLANTGKLGLENQMLRAKLPLFHRYFDIMSGNGGATGNATGNAAGGNAPSTTTAPSATTTGTPIPAPDDASASPLDGYADRVSMIEANGNPDAKNPNSSATGLGAFTKPTWLDLARRTFPETAQMGDDALLSLRTNGDFSKEMIKAYARDNAPVLADAGLPVNSATLYAAHFLGPGGAVKVLTADPDTPLKNLLDPKAISANPNLKGKTAADFSRMIAMKMNVPGNIATTMRPVQIAQNGPLTSLPAMPQADTQGTAAAPAGVPLPSGVPTAASTASPSPVAAGSPPAINGITPQQAAQLTALGPMLGITPPQWMQDLARMAPGGALSPQYIGQAKAAEAAAEYPYKMPEALAPQFERGQQARQTAQFTANLKTNPNAFNYSPGALPPGPGTTEPVPVPPSPQHPMPSVLPPVADAAPIVGSQTQIEDQQKEWGKEQNAWNAQREENEIAVQRLSAIGDAMKMVETGAYTKDLADFNALLKRAGIGPFKSLPDPAQVQIILKNNFQAAISTMKGTGNSRWTQRELQGAQESMANPDLQPGANQAIIAQAIGTLQWENSKINDFAQAKRLGWRDPTDFERAWVARNPLQPIIDRTTAQIGPLKGMPGASGTPAAAAPAAIAAIPPRLPTATGPGGHKIMLQGGRWVDMQTGQPIAP